jgi:hypothetical protein
MSEFKKLFVLVDKHGIVFSNGSAVSQQLASERLLDRISHGKFHKVQVASR